MFKPQGLFSGISCPHQEQCVLPGCIFRHSENQMGSADAPTITAENEIVNGLAVSDGQDATRKRRKIAPEDSTTISVVNVDNKVPQGITETKNTKSKQESSSHTPEKSRKPFSSVFREISPPPLRKKSVDGNVAHPKQSTSTSDGIAISNPPQPIASKVDAKTPTAAPAKLPIKTESLNPRLLKHSPSGHDFRYKLVKALHEHFVRLNRELANDANDEEEKLVLSDQELITKALDFEEDAAGSPSIYPNIMKNKIMVYKRMTVSQWKEERAREIANSKVLGASDKPVTKPPKPIETGLTPRQELLILPRLYTPITGLSSHGYISAIPTAEDIELARQGIEAAKGWEVCDRCKSRFQVFPDRREDGALSSNGPCNYHFGKPYWQDRSATDPKAKREKKYRCCGQSIGDSPGCTQSESHVFKITETKRLASVLNFANTPENDEISSENPVCIDGEMGYTVYGLELVRLTATSWPSGSELLDVLVRPVGQILDLNSRYSGVWPKDMQEAIPWNADPQTTTRKTEPDTRRKLCIVPSPAAARSLLFKHLSPQTPLIGHGLENDMNALRLIHPTIIDTALLFPHKAGLPYRNGLKALMSTHLNRDIQVVVDGRMEGHDSKEDANAAGDLVRFAVGKEWENMRREGWTFVDGSLVEPIRKAPKGAPTGPMGGERLSVEYLERGVGAGRKRSRDEMEEGEI
ncbi:hypothetical protein B7494_g3627 [Chlorociboria aeruginascens]|nr:hypothetical protein B7494_g3627 [Chlorociboria aeruginascens]